MTHDLWMLLAAAALQWMLILAPVPYKIFKRGVLWSMGNREPSAGGDDTPAWLGRVERANGNMAENLPLFAILVLVAHVSGAADANSSLGASVFVGARVAHAIVYAVGIHGLRTLCWCGSIAGLGMIVASIVT